MNSSEAITKIKVLLGLENEVTQKFESAVLVDGTQIEVEGPFEVGKAVSIVTAEGPVAASAGMHETENGMILTTDENGVIIEISEAATETVEETPTEEAMEEVAVEVPEEVAPAMTEEVVQAVVEALAPVVAEVQQIAEELKKVKKEFQAFKAEPAAKKVKRNDFSAEMEKVADRIANIRKINKK